MGTVVITCGHTDPRDQSPSPARIVKLALEQFLRFDHARIDRAYGFVRGQGMELSKTLFWDPASQRGQTIGDLGYERFGYWWLKAGEWVFKPAES